jgi:hypothetical protein
MRAQWWRPVVLLACVALLGFFFAKVEIQIEGPQGWAAGLPTWRIEQHWLLNIFWGGRPMTGYHAWIFSFMALAFHLPFAFYQRWSWTLQARAIGALALFWIIEDCLWFVLNPAFGWERFTPEIVPWHKEWFLGLPVDYWTFSVVGLALIAWSFFRRSAPVTATPAPRTPRRRALRRWVSLRYTPS